MREVKSFSEQTKNIEKAKLVCDLVVIFSRHLSFLHNIVKQMFVLSASQEIIVHFNHQVSRVFLLAFILHHMYSFVLRIPFLQTHATSHSFQSSVTIFYTAKEKGGKPDWKPYPVSYELRNPYRNLKSQNSDECIHTPKSLCISQKRKRKSKTE